MYSWTRRSLIFGFLAPYLVSIVLLVRARHSMGHDCSLSILGLGRESSPTVKNGGLKSTVIHVGGKGVDSQYDARSGLVQGIDEGGMEMGGFQSEQRREGDRY